MKIVLIYFNSVSIPKSRIHHSVKDYFIDIWQKKFKESNSVLEPILAIDSKTVVPKNWDYDYKIIKNSNPPFMNDILNKVGWMKAQCYDYFGKCVVSDIDALINNNIDEIKSINHPISMAYDKSRRTYPEWPEVGEELNAGFMILNNEKIFSTFQKLYTEKKFYSNITYYDELIFSHICREMNGYVLPIEYNQTWEKGDLFKLFSHFSNKKNKIIHFHGNRKEDLEKIIKYESRIDRKNAFKKIDDKTNLEEFKDKFLIVSNQRSGSHLLQSLLNSHTKIKFAGEALINSIRWIGENENNKEKISASALKNYCGFIYQREYDEKDNFLKLIKSNPNIGVLYLHRRNILKQFLSLKIAKKTKKFQMREDQEIIQNNEKINIDFNDFMQYHKNIKDLFLYFWNILNENEIRTLVIEYEDIFNNINNIQKFMGLNIEQLKTGLIKQEHRKIKEIVINYNDLKKFLEKENMTEYLDESF